METNKKQSEKFNILLGDDKHQILAHILSPLELEALKKNYQPFVYQLEEIDIPISSSTCKQLLNVCTLKVKIFSTLLDREIIFSSDDSARLRLFLESPIHHLNLSTRLRHSLLSRDCHTMLEVIEVGRKGILRARGIGKCGLKEIDELLKKNDCDYLFI